MITTLFTAVVDAPLIHQPVWPYVLAIISGAGFGFLGRKTGYGSVLWAIAAASFALALSTIAYGLANAAALPYTDATLNRRQVVALIVSVVLIVTAAVLLVVLGKVQLPIPTRKDSTANELGSAPKSGNPSL